MIIGIPRGRRDCEYRVGMIPVGVKLLSKLGHVCYIEHDAGLGCGYSDQAYIDVGGSIAYSGEEVFGRADLILTISPPTSEEYSWMREGSILMGFLSLAAANPKDVRMLLDKKITAIGYEIIQEDDGYLPVLYPASQVAGRMVPQIAATLAQNNYGGKGILLGGIPGVPPAEIVIIGAGNVGTSAAQTFLGMGATVYLLDQNLRRLHEIDSQFKGRVITMVSHDFNIAKVCRFADVLVGAVLVPGARTPIVVTREMVRTMRPHSIIIDVSIDQGGCVETSRPTTHSVPTFIEENVIHYCVPNITSVLGRSATHAINNATWPFIHLIATQGLDTALNENAPFKRGIYTFSGSIVHPTLKTAYESRR